MKENNQSKLITLKIAADKPVFASQADTRIIEISLETPLAQTDQLRRPLNLAIVLDKSGSMHGEKLHFVKNAAAHVVDLLGEKDRAAVVVYDDRVETLFPSQYLTQPVKHQAKARIQQVRSGASTNLHGGWLQGCRLVAESAVDQTFNRTLLLTDGLANVGLRDIGELSVQSQSLFMRGISTSCFGVGRGYDEHLLEAMANFGGGSFHFLETLEAIPLVFEREFDEMIHMALHDVEVVLELPEDANVTVSAGWHHKREGQKLTIFLGGLTAESQKQLYLQVSNLAGDIAIPVKVFGKDADQAVHQVMGQLDLKKVSKGDAEVHETDQDLMGRFALVDMADRANEALKRERAGDREGSYQVMQKSIELHRDQLSESDTAVYSNMAASIKVGMDELERKRHHFHQYQSKRGFRAVRDYRLDLEPGGLVAEIEGSRVLIHTAAPRSIGVKTPWTFLGDWYPLPSADGSLACDQISSDMGKPIDVVLGMDILKDLFMRVDHERRVVAFSRHPMRGQGQAVPMQNHDGLPGCTIQVNDSHPAVAWATALKLSYVDPALLAGREPQGEEEDFCPGLGRFSTPVFQLPIILHSREIQLRCAPLTLQLTTHFNLHQAAGLLGASSFDGKPIILGFPDQQIILQYDQEGR